MKSSALGGASLLVPAAAAQPVQGPIHGDALELGEPEISNMDGSTALENERLRIEVSPRSGDIVSLYNKQTGKEYLAAKELARIFRLNVPFPGRITGYFCDYSANSLDSWKQNHCKISVERGENGKTLTAQWGELESEAGRFPIDVRCSMRLPDNSDEVSLQMEVHNRSQYCVKEVFFPWISGVGAIEGSDTDNFVTSIAIHRVRDLRAVQSANWDEYPYLLDLPPWPGGGQSTMPWIDYGSGREGLYLASLDRESIHHMLMLQNFGESSNPILGIAWAFAPYIKPGGSWRTPEMILSLHAGDWHVAADKYRASLAGWHQRPDTPAAFKRPFASFNSTFTDRTFDQIVTLAEDCRKYGVRDLIMWNFGNYYPNVLEEDDLSVDPPRLGLFTAQWGGLSRLKAANEKARSMGVRSGIIFSQLFWNLAALTPQLRQLAENWALRRDSGDPIVESWEHQRFGAGQWSSTQRWFGHLGYKMCEANEDWQKFAIDNFVGVLEQGGYTTVFHDEAATYHYLCFNPSHHHADVSAPCMAAYGYMKSLKTAMRKTNPDAILIAEGWSVGASQSVDMSWAWDHFPNPEIFRYALPWVSTAVATNVDRAEANRYFVLGIHLAIIPKSVESGKKLSDFPDFAKHLSDLGSFHEKTERFWVEGLFQDDMGLRVPNAFGKVYTTGNELAVMIANLSDKPVDASVELDRSRYGIATTSYATISSNGQSAQGNFEESGSTLKGVQPLAPYEVIAVIVQRQGRG